MQVRRISDCISRILRVILEEKLDHTAPDTSGRGHQVEAEHDVRSRVFAIDLPARLRLGSAARAPVVLGSSSRLATPLTRARTGDQAVREPLRVVLWVCP